MSPARSILLTVATLACLGGVGLFAFLSTSNPAPIPTPTDGMKRSDTGSPTRRQTSQKPSMDRIAQKPALSEGLSGLTGGVGEQVGTGGLAAKGLGSGGGGLAGYGTGVAMPPAPTARFTDYGVNAHVLTEVDPLSTFSIDVDTASYARAREYIVRGSLPPIGSVRVEEFINAQHYGYPPPDDAPFSVTMEASPSPFIPGHHLLRVGVEAAEPPNERPPVHLTFLVDVSGSMRSPNKLPLAQRALHKLVDSLDGDDRVALVTYAGHTGVVLTPTRASNKDKIHRAIDSLRSGGGTAMSDGMTLAYELAHQTLMPGTENRVVVLSDGDANIGKTSHQQILATLKGYADQGISMSTIGFGRGNDTLMEQLANKGDGNYYYIDSFQEAQKVFGVNLAGTLLTVARDVKLQVEFNPQAVISYRLLGYENRNIADRDFRNDKVDAGEIGSGHTVTALYDVILTDHPADTLATVRVRSKPPGPDAPAVERYTKMPSGAIHPRFVSASRDFQVAVGAATFAEVLRRSPFTEEVSLTQLAALIKRARRNPDDDELVSLIERAAALDRGRLTQR